MGIKNTPLAIALILSTLLFWKCQLLKEPAAKIMSTSLPTPKIDSNITFNQYTLADFNLRVKDLDGNLISMSAYRGQVIFLNFWATWCLPCVAELPSLNKLYQELKEENIAFLLITNEDLAKAKAYHIKKKYEIPFHIIDQEGNMPKSYFSPTIPTTFIINKEGHIIRKSYGAEDWDDKKFIKEIRALL
jgi:thiol-disulfide isomerase/thioredoxin